jgi:choline-glycine betaine transporter
LTDWGLTAGIFFGLLAIAVAIGFGLGKRVDDFLKETKRGTVDEKIAMLYGYAVDVKKWIILIKLFNIRLKESSQIYAQ